MLTNRRNCEMKLKVKVTQVKISLPFVKVTARNRISDSLSKLKILYDNAPKTDLGLGDICVAFVAQNHYERCRIIKDSGITSIVSVSYTDSGVHAEVPRRQLRILRDEEMKGMAPLCSEYVLAGVFIDSSSIDYKDKIRRFHDRIINKNFSLLIRKETDVGTFVDLQFGEKSLVNDLILKDRTFTSCFKPFIMESQISEIENKSKNSGLKLQKPRTLLESPEVLPDEAAPFEVQFKAASADSEHSVRITAHDNGPWSFYVFFTYQDNNYQQFQSQLQKFKNRRLVPLRIRSVGTKCLVMDQNQLFRAEVLMPEGKRVEGQHLIRCMENGEKVIVPSNQMYELPSTVSSVPPFAKKFQLAGVKKGSFNPLHENEVNFYFQRITSNKLLTLKTSPASGHCHLFNGKVSIFEELKRWSPHGMKYLPPKQLPKGVSSHVAVCSYFSPKLFYVIQMETNEHLKYESMLDRLKHFDPPKLQEPRKGDACLIKVKDDDTYLRNIVIGAVTKNIFKCQAVDTGFIDEYHEAEIKIIVPEFLELPPMAVRCALSGLDKRRDKPEVSKCFEDICRRYLEFQMKIVDSNDGLNIVELEDCQGRKVASLIKPEAGQGSDFVEFSDWTSAANHRIRSRRQNRSPSPNESILTLAESPRLARSSSELYDEGLDLEGEFSSLDTDAKNSTSHDDGINLSINAADSLWGGSDRYDVERENPFEFEADENQNDQEDNGNAQRHRAMSLPNPGDYQKVVKERYQEAGTSKGKEGLSSSSSTSGFESDVSDAQPRGEPVKITAVVKPTEFTIQKACNIKKYENLSIRLQESASTLMPLVIFDKGSTCVAYNRLAKLWCRAIILDSSSEGFQVSVKCLDKGDTFTVEDKNELKVLGITLLFNTRFGIDCALPIRVDSKREQEVVDYLIKIRNNDLCYQEIVKIRTRVIIELYDDGKNVADTLVEKKLATRICVAPSGLGYINHVVSPTEFCVQPEYVTETYGLIIEYTDNYRRRPIKNPQVGMLVIAKYKRDNCWYRAKIESVSKNEFFVHFIDHGNSDYVVEIGAIDNQKIADTPQLAFKCSLVMPASFESFSKEATKKFMDLANLGKTQFRIEFVKPQRNAALVNVYDKEHINIINIINSGHAEPARNNEVFK